MTDAKKKKKHAEAILLYSENQAFLDGRKLDAINHKDVKDTLAKQKHLSTMHDIEARDGMGCATFFGIVMFLLSIWGIYIFGKTQNYYPMLTLLFALIPAVFVIYRGTLAINYRPGRVNQIYQTWLKRGIVVEGEIVSVSSYKNTAIISYQFTDDNGDTVQGSYLTQYMVIPRSVHQDNFEALKNKTIYILYADKKLHTPL